MITGNIFDREGVLCPKCKFEYTHLKSVQFGLSDDFYSIIKQVAITPDGNCIERECKIKSDFRGNEVRLFFEGECWHKWVIIFSEHKGNIYCRAEMIETSKERYHKYLLSPEWKTLAAQKREEAENKCQLCNARESVLHVHHRSYDNIYHETLKDLIVLCEKCHQKFHNKEITP